jgi:hypothetical protein
LIKPTDLKKPLSHNLPQNLFQAVAGAANDIKEVSLLTRLPQHDFIHSRVFIDFYPAKRIFIAITTPISAAYCRASIRRILLKNKIR